MKINFGEKGLVKLGIEAVGYLKHEGLKETVLHTLLVLKRAMGIYIPSNDVADYAAYESHYEEEQDYSGYQTDVKALAFFLPQFHAIPENDEWWGKGFTEWVNTEKAEPRFRIHYQPRRPHKNIGFYDLSKIETLKKQAELAKRHGIYGFCFYHYWFSGKRLLEKPVDMLLEHPEIEMPFCLCWANENWTRTWSGNQKDVMMAQEYSEADRKKFIDDMQKYISDSRYIRINGKPVIVVYNAGEIPERVETFHAWRRRAKEIGIGEILIWTCRTSNHTAEEMDILDVVDAEVEFPPHNLWGYEETWIRDLDLSGKSANIYNYQKLVDIICRNLKEKKAEKIPVYRTSMMGWDNACRRQAGWTTYYAYSPKSFYDWNAALVSDARNKFKEEERFIFVNAWNEWAEGTYLEPDEKYGYVNINTFSKAVFDLPYKERILLTSQVEIDELSSLKEDTQIAVQCHIYYMDTVESIIKSLKTIPYRFDCYVTTDSIEKKQKLEEIFVAEGIQKVQVDIYPNQGRDVAPFLLQMKTCYKKYKYICHIHSKKTSTSGYGDFWRDYLYKHLFGSERNIQAIFNLFEKDKTIGLIYPDTYPILMNQEEWGGNRPGCETLMKQLGIEAELSHEIRFPVGNMFWMRSEAVEKVLGYDWKMEEFPEEQGQVNLTLGHQIERIWKLAVEDAGYKVQLVYNDIQKPEKEKAHRLFLFAHFNKDKVIDDSDVAFVKQLSENGEVVFVTNSGTLEENEKIKIKDFIVQLFERENNGYDFGAWKDAIINTGIEKIREYEEVVLVNNSCYSPVFPLTGIFEQMRSHTCDMWSMTEFPYISDGSFIGKNCIKRHLQSYFVVFRKSILETDSFMEYWENVEEYNVMEEVVANCESEMTDFFEKKGYKAEAYIEESGMAREYMGSYAIPFEFPYQMLLLGNPLMKKKAEWTIKCNEKNLVNEIRRKCNYAID